MSTLAILMVLLLAVVETLASYISRVYSEFGKILTREVEENPVSYTHLDVYKRQGLLAGLRLMLW